MLRARALACRPLLGARPALLRAGLCAAPCALSKSAAELDSFSTEHFRVSTKKHPLRTKDTYLAREREMSDKMGRQQNHIWTAEELQKALATAHDRHQPTELSDKLMYGIMYYGMYHPFNLLTGYRHNDPSPRAIEWRLIVLESFAGVPGFVAAGMRHFRSLRVLQRDYGWIHTLLEEAENERMHLLVCLKMFDAGPVTRLMCVGAQLLMTPFLMGVYILKPKAMHRFVGYLEQTACETYHNIISHIETPGTQLHSAWKDLDAPEIAKGYWKLPEDAKWVDTLRCIYADESHHRDVNHTFATMEGDDPNPFQLKHKEDAARAWKLEEAKRVLEEHQGVLK